MKTHNELIEINSKLRAERDRLFCELAGLKEFLRSLPAKLPHYENCACHACRANKEVGRMIEERVKGL